MDEIDRYTAAPEAPRLYERAPYLTTHRAVAACDRELSRLSDMLRERAEFLAAGLGAPKPVIRRPPGRCLIQFGPVALTVVWMRNAQASIATGELMAIVWQGAVAPRQQHNAERPGQDRVPVPAAPLWERVFTAVAETEDGWLWHVGADDPAGMSSSTVAALCMEHLGQAYRAVSPAVEV